MDCHHQVTKGRLPAIRVYVNPAPQPFMACGVFTVTAHPAPAFPKPRLYCPQPFFGKPPATMAILSSSKYIIIPKGDADMKRLARHDGSFLTLGLWLGADHSTASALSCAEPRKVTEELKPRMRYSGARWPRPTLKPIYPKANMYSRFPSGGRENRMPLPSPCTPMAGNPLKQARNTSCSPTKAGKSSNPIYAGIRVLPHPLT